jgi:ATP-binding cassette subfamily B multidrug efflux pump
MILLTNYWRVRVRDAYRATRQRLSLINGYLNESISGIRVTKSFTREERQLPALRRPQPLLLRRQRRGHAAGALFFPGVDFIGSLATALVVGVGGWLVLGDALTAGTLVAFVLYVERFFEPIRELAQRYNTFQATMAASSASLPCSIPSRTCVDAPDAMTCRPCRAEVEFDHVSFAIKDGEPVLHDVSLVRRAGPAHRPGGRDGRGQEHHHPPAGPLFRRDRARC